MLPAGRVGFPCQADAETVAGRRAGPFPRAACKNHTRAELIVLFQHTVIGFLLFRVIIPVDQCCVFWNRTGYLWIHSTFRRIILPAGSQPKEHITPQHGLKPKAFRYGMHPFKMPQHQFHSIFIAVLLQICPQAHHMGLIHADIDAFP